MFGFSENIKKKNLPVDIELLPTERGFIAQGYYKEKEPRDVSLKAKTTFSFLVS